MKTSAAGKVQRPHLVRELSEEAKTALEEMRKEIADKGPENPTNVAAKVNEPDTKSVEVKSRSRSDSRMLNSTSATNSGSSSKASISRIHGPFETPRNLRSKDERGTFGNNSGRVSLELNTDARPSGCSNQEQECWKSHAQPYRLQKQESFVITPLGYDSRFAERPEPRDAKMDADILREFHKEAVEKCSNWLRKYTAH